jgi:hypothetical protein
MLALSVFVVGLSFAILTVSFRGRLVMTAQARVSRARGPEGQRPVGASTVAPTRELMSSPTAPGPAPIRNRTASAAPVECQGHG